MTIEISNGKDIVMTNRKNKLKLKSPILNQNMPQIVNGNILRQKIDFKDAVFPVTADPTWCGDKINSAKWVERVNEGGAYPDG